MFKTDLNDLESKNVTVINQKNEENTLISSAVLITKPLHNKSEDQSCTNSTENLKEHKVLRKQKHTIRKNFSKASIFNNVAVTNPFSLNKNDGQKCNDPIIDEPCQAHSEKHIDPYNSYGSNIISDTMKIKLRRLLSKHKDGILCNNFLNVYSNEYNSHLNFFEYGFSSMKDMACKLPSVFHVKLTEDGNQSILFKACVRTELENKLNDPSLFYTNIPKTILENLSQFFHKNRTGVRLDKMMILYRSKYGRSYEPLNYGYSSEKHMFECLSKMVKIKNDVLYTVDPFAYTKLSKTIKLIDTSEKNALTLPDNDFLLDYTSHDICNGRFKYYKLKLNDLELIDVIVAEIYNPSSFYIQLAREVDILNSFMDDLQEFYNENEEKYKVLPKLILPELACTSYTKGTNLWHRAKVLKIVDEENVQLFFVDYGSIAIIPKLNIRLLQLKFSSYPAQAVYCGLYKCTEYNYSREISESFADMVEHQVLQAQVHQSIPEDDSKTLLTLFLNTKYDHININKRISKVASVQQSPKQK
ncbi:tudor domain-containing protein 5-like isoform X2 [Aphis gossypii]|uniref:tudor domain-containing protein 5-like isoform X2 n=1 Tax=Aphis gossypii TaxID=80765 RepID=UPI0021597B36|nr:tudor domain-containing protein 5-like isoform X2 [Aphis gossypii]